MRLLTLLSQEECARSNKSYTQLIMFYDGVLIVGIVKNSDKVTDQRWQLVFGDDSICNV